MLAQQHLGGLTASTKNASAGCLRILTTKPAKVIVTALAALCFAVIAFHSFYGIPASLTTDTASVPHFGGDVPSTRPEIYKKGRLHLLVPATSSNADLCKLLLSAQILGWPTPVLINYGDHEEKNPYVQHLAKVNGLLRYLEQIKPSEEYEEDLVLIIDGYDIWFQLRPDVLIKRFYEINNAADARWEEVYGTNVAKYHGIKQTVIFGPDKICWPVDFKRPACWAVPESPTSSLAFGPDPGARVNRARNQARWLNSGTVMGPVQDMKDVFQATLDEINKDHTTDSDQFYFANVFGLQEYARLKRRPDLLEQAKQVKFYDFEDHSNGTRLEPEIKDQKTEYHIGIDYDSSMFQTLAFWKQHLAWSRAIDSWRAPYPQRLPNNPYEIEFAADIQNSTPPFDALKNGHPGNVHGHPGWEGVQLVYNAITKQFPVLLHVTGNPREKNFRAWWWQKLWFQAEAEKLQLASNKLNNTLITEEPIGGIRWFNAEPEDAREISVASGKGGAWNDRGGWMSWTRLCKRVEEKLYTVPDDGNWHPRQPPKEEHPATELDALTEATPGDER